MPWSLLSVDCIIAQLADISIPSTLLERSSTHFGLSPGVFFHQLKSLKKTTSSTGNFQISPHIQSVVVASSSSLAQECPSSLPMLFHYTKPSFRTSNNKILQTHPTTHCEITKSHATGSQSQSVCPFPAGFCWPLELRCGWGSKKPHVIYLNIIYPHVKLNAILPTLCIGIIIRILIVN